MTLPDMPVLPLDPGSDPAGITHKLIIDATTPTAPDDRGHYSQGVVPPDDTAAWVERLGRLVAGDRKENL
nr:hypothetical protein [Pseudonocardia sp. AL041005-10]